MIPHVLIIHTVDDYARWKQIFDDAEPIRQEAGELAFQVLRDTTDPNRIVHFSRWASLAQARAFFESQRLVEIRKAAGVHAPTFLYLEEVDHGTLAATGAPEPPKG